LSHNDFLVLDLAGSSLVDPAGSANSISSTPRRTIVSIHTVDTETASATQQKAPTSRGFARPLLWLLLVISATGNVVMSVSNMLVVSIPLGLITLSLGTALVVSHYRGRR
jgi:hypothetical protein